MSEPDKKSNEPYRQLEESHGAELNVGAQSTSSCPTSLENTIEGSMELSSVVVIPDGMLYQIEISYKYVNDIEVIYCSV